MKYIIVYALSLLGILFILFSCEDSVKITPEVLIRIDRSEDFCQQGGTQFNLGFDDDNNGSLEDNEITLSQMFCDDQYDDQIGIDWAYGDQLGVCDSEGGIQLSIYYDWDKDGIRGNGEEVFLLGICDIYDIKMLLLEAEIVDFGGVCGGGYQVKLGIDSNSNNVLEENEVEETTVILNRAVYEDKAEIDITLSNEDYQRMAVEYAYLNYNAATNMAVYNNFHLMLWSEEELDTILKEQIEIYGTKVNCQVYKLTYEGYPEGTQTRNYNYSSETGYSVVE